MTISAQKPRVLRGDSEGIDPASTVLCESIAVMSRGCESEALLVTYRKTVQRNTYFGGGFDYFRSALRVALSVNSSDSRGMLSTNGRMIQASPLGMERVSVTDSICM